MDVKVGDTVYMFWPNAPTPEQRVWIEATVTAVHELGYVDLLVDGMPRTNVAHASVADAGSRLWTKETWPLIEVPPGADPKFLS